MKKSLLEKYCKKKHFPYDEKIGNTLGFLLYQLNYNCCKLKNEIVRRKK